MKEASVLTGNLVRLRPIEPTDLERYYTWINDPEVARFLATRWLYSMAEEEEFVRTAAKQTRPPEVKLAIDTLEDGRHIGSVNLHAIQMEDRRATLGVMIGDKSYWDHGYGSDAIRTIVRYGFEELNLQRVDLTCDERNERGIACYRKCGFVEEGRMRKHRFAGGRYWDTVMMAVLVDDYFAGREVEQ